MGALTKFIMAETTILAFVFFFWQFNVNGDWSCKINSTYYSHEVCQDILNSTNSGLCLDEFPHSHFEISGAAALGFSLGLSFWMYFCQVFRLDCGYELDYKRLFYLGGLIRHWKLVVLLFFAYGAIICFYVLGSDIIRYSEQHDHICTADPTVFFLHYNDHTLKGKAVFLICYATVKAIAISLIVTLWVLRHCFQWNLSKILRKKAKTEFHNITPTFMAGDNPYEPEESA